MGEERTPTRSPEIVKEIQRAEGALMELRARLRRVVALDFTEEKQDFRDGVLHGMLSGIQQYLNYAGDKE